MIKIPFEELLTEGDEPCVAAILRHPPPNRGEAAVKTVGTEWRHTKGDRALLDLGVIAEGGDQLGRASAGDWTPRLRNWLAGEAVKWLKIWLDSAGIPEGAIFRRLVGQGRVGERLHPDIMSDKRVAQWIGMSEKQVKQVSGHSVRVGATQDPFELNINLASVMRAGRWKSTRMPMRYGEEIGVGRGAIAMAAELQGRNSKDPDK
jgi:hypothetical protein